MCLITSLHKLLHSIPLQWGKDEDIPIITTDNRSPMKFNTASYGEYSKTMLDCDVTTVKFVLPHSKDMATCSYSEFVGGCCGPSSGNPANIQCVTLGKCNKDVSGHLKSYKVRDSCVDTEASLLLARAGNFILPVM